MQRFRRASVAGWVLLWLVGGCGGDPTGESRDAGVGAGDARGADAGDAGGADAGADEQQRKLCSAIDEFRAAVDVPGVVVAGRFADGSERVCAAGSSDLGAGSPMLADARFRIGSVTKTFVAALVLLLVEDGALSLDDPLSRFITGFGSDPTLAQMLNHTSGLGEYLFDDGLRSEQDRAHTQSELVEIARSKPAVRAPGGRFEYSNTNYMLLAEIIGVAGGRPWFDQLRDRVLDPLGLGDTFAYGFEETPEIIRGYEPVDGDFVDVTMVMHPTVAATAGCMVSSAHDLLRWTYALYGGELLRPDSLDAMLNRYRVPHAHDTGVYEGSFVGLATFIGVDATFGEEYGHAGGIPGSTTEMRYLQRDERAIVVNYNATTTSDDLSVLTGLAWQAVLL